MRSDSDIERDVEAELKWAPDVHEGDIAVKVTDGEVTLSGFVPTFLDKYRATAAVVQVTGVAAVADDLEVHSPSGPPSDPEIARAAIHALKLVLPLNWENVRAVVNSGHVSLEGTLEWHYQREKAEDAMRHLNGVLGVRNSIRIRPSLSPDNIKHRIEAGLQASRSDRCRTHYGRYTGL
jgi:osmotically-inducible protein OsmY